MATYSGSILVTKIPHATRVNKKYSGTILETGCVTIGERTQQNQFGEVISGGIIEINNGGSGITPPRKFPLEHSWKKSISRN